MFVIQFLWQNLLNAAVCSYFPYFQNIDFVIFLGVEQMNYIEDWEDIYSNANTSDIEVFHIKGEGHFMGKFLFFKIRPREKPNATKSLFLVPNFFCQIYSRY